MLVGAPFHSCSESPSALVTRWVVNVPNMVVRDSAASRNSVVETAFPLDSSMGTLVKVPLKVSRMVPPSGITAVVAMVSGRREKEGMERRRVWNGTSSSGWNPDGLLGRDDGWMGGIYGVGGGQGFKVG
jgi:hypothetical protein